MLQRLRQISISSSLRGAFLTGALLTLIVSSVSLYSWHEQSSQIRYSLDEYFPRIHAAFLIEGNLNLVVDQLNEFLLAPNTTVRLQLRNQIIQHLDKIERLSQGLSPAERQQLGVILQDSRALLAELDRVLYNMFLVREKVGELAARIDWLHDDFTTELNSLVQDFTWQQGTLLDQIEARQGDARQYLKRAREVQNEQQQVYTLARIENQIVDDLRDRLNELKSGNDDGMLVETHIRYLENLKKTADENIRALDDWPSTITLRQTIDELLEIGMVKNNMPDTMRDYVSAQKALVEASRSREATLGRFRTLLEAQLGSSHQQMQMFNQRMAQIVRVSGGLILVATLLALLLAWGLNYCFAMTQIGCQPLSKRPDDIEPLFHHYLQKTCQRLNHPVPEVDAGLLKGMMRRVWPNNVRELANAAELFAVGVLPLAETVNPLMHIGEPTPLDQRVEDVERQIITEALNIHQGRINEVAEYLLIPRKKLYLRMKKYGLNKEHYKGV